MLFPCQFKCSSTSLLKLQTPKRIDHNDRRDDKILQLTEVHRQQLAELKLRNEKLQKEKASKEVVYVVMSVHVQVWHIVDCMVTPASNSLVTIYTWMERDIMRVKCLDQDQNTMSLARVGNQTARSNVDFFLLLSMRLLCHNVIF